jgi:glycosyltransferase involved in cell wall biosynthesis
MSDKNSRIFIVVPAYNEAAVIESVIREIQSHRYSNLIVVDDGSTDRTAEKSAQLENVITLRHRLNRGKGAATKTGIEAAKLLGADVIVTLDGDGQHDPADIEKLTRPILQKRADVALGTRLINPAGMPWYKIIHNKLGNLLTWYLFGLWVTDSQSGFRAYSRRAAEKINTRGDRYEYESEVIREIYIHKLTFKEVPIRVRYTDYSMNKAQKQSFCNGVKTAGKMLWKMIG